MSKLNFQDFAQELVNHVSEIATGKVTFHEVTKNNEINIHGITIMKDGENISPTIYIDEFYQDYLNGKCTVLGAAYKVVQISNQHKPDFAFDIKSFLQFENVKNKLIMKLVNTKANEEYLASHPHTQFLDMSILYQVEVTRDDIGNGVITVDDKIAKLWNVTAEQLHESAMKNQKGAVIQSMNHVIADLIELEEEDMELPDDVGMHVITNELKVHGASVILSKDTTQRLEQIFDGDFFILPSSVHELIAMKVTDDADVNYLKEMVTDINRTQLKPDEVLSDNVYRYDVAEQRLVIA